MADRESQIVEFVITWAPFSSSNGVSEVVIPVALYPEDSPAFYAEMIRKALTVEVRRG